MFTILVVGGVAAVGLMLMVAAMMWRVVVPTNDVHVVQSAKKTTSYGKGSDAGNTYWAWPSWVPIFGIKVIKLPMSVFDVSLEAYPGYDKGRVPFVVDIMAFFRITHTDLAAERVLSQQELVDQLKSILQGSVRAILAQSEIEEILEGRGRFGDMFTKEVDDNLKEWGVQTVKCIELMDIRDSEGSQVISNIMMKKKSLIEKESRVEVAKNRQIAETAEIEAKQTVAVRQQEAEQVVGQRTAEKNKQIGIAQQKSDQEVKEEARNTAEKDMAVKKVQEVRAAEIARDVQVVQADRDRQSAIIEADGRKQTAVIQADGEKQQTVLVAEGKLEAAKRNAEGVRVQGEAEGAAETAKLMAPVNSQITLAKEIGSNEGYQAYLIEIRKVEASQAVGTAQAEALTKADVKVIANAGDTITGVNKAMDLFSTKGGTALAGMIEGLSQSAEGKALIDRFTGGLTKEAPVVDEAPTAGADRTASWKGGSRSKGNGSAA